MKYVWTYPLLILACTQTWAQVTPLANENPNEIIVKWKSSHGLAHLKEIGLLQNVQESDLAKELNITLLQFSDREATSQEMLEKLRAQQDVQWAQLNHQLSERMAPNDPNYDDQWSLTSKPHDHLGAESAWDQSQLGSTRDVTLAIVDGGMDTTHPDLVENLWTNPGEIPNNQIDDDKNGYVDDIHGWDIYDNVGTIPPHKHGTHVSGIMGARGDNQLGITGVNWDIHLMALAGSSTSTAVVIKAYNYILTEKKLYISSQGQLGANVVAVNSSFGVDFANCQSKDYPAWNDLFNELGKVGVLSVAATANRNVNVDEVGDVPTGCDSPYVIAVTNTTSSSIKYVEAGFGVKNIDLGAPGTDILSTLPDGAYGLMTGTSMATPHVTGAIGLMMKSASTEFWNFYATSPAQAALELKRVLLNSVKPNDSLAGKTVTGGILHLGQATSAISSWK